MARILVVDDEPGMREFFQDMLDEEGYHTDCAQNGSEAVSLVRQNPYDLVISDIRMPGMDGIEVLKKVKELSPETLVIMISAYGTMKTAVMAMKQGAYDYIPKPFNVDETTLIIQKALENKHLREENERLKEELKRHHRYNKLIGNSPAMLKVYNLIKKVAKTRSNILIYGESGTGKELVARAIHAESPRSKQNFVAINCGGIPETLIESELFGHLKGAFTGAVSDQKGLFAVADGGTVFLDEITALSPTLQVKLLRVLQERVFRPVGGTKNIPIDIHLISATNQDLEKEVTLGNFREDLFYRLNVIQIEIPPLRERKEDIPLLSQHFLKKYAAETKKPVNKISGAALEILMQYHFPGNVRELENIIERTVALASSETIQAEDLPPISLAENQKTNTEGSILTDGFNLDEYLAQIEKDSLLKALEISKGAKQKASDILGISFRSFRHRLSKYGL